MSEIEILKTLVQFNTVQDKENEKIVLFLEEFFKTYNFITKRIGNGPYCLEANTGENPSLGFVCHMDTVSSSTEWKKDPFSLSCIDEKLYGLGVCDMKGGIAALLSAISKTDFRNKKGLSIYFTFDEEVGFSGIQEFICNKTSFPKKIILPEPTDLVPIIASKGCLEFKVTVKGKATHSSTPFLGKNAITKASKIIKEIELFYEKVKIKTNSTFEIPYTTYNISTIVGGSDINKVPDICTFTFDFRTVCSAQNKEIISEIKNITIDENVQLEILNNVKPIVNQNQEMISYLEKITKNKKSGVNYTTEASFIDECELVILGPGPVTAHMKDEYIMRESFEKTIDIYIKILEKYL